MTSKPRKQTPMAALPEVPPVRDEAAELAAQLAATQESGESAAAPAADERGTVDVCGVSQADTYPHLDAVTCTLPRDHDGSHVAGDNAWSSTLPHADPEATEAVEGETETPIGCTEHFPRGWRGLHPDATMTSCAHGQWRRFSKD